MTWNDLLTKNSNCPCCSGQKTSVSNCLAIKNPNLTSEWHSIKNGDLTPYTITVNSGKKVWWQCSKNPKHEWLMDVKSRNRGNGCPFCRGLYASEDYNLLIDNQKLCEEWNYDKNDKLPNEYTPHSKQKVWWICSECGNEWVTSISDRNNGVGCPECSKSHGEKECKRVLLLNGFIEILQENYNTLSDTYKNKNEYFIPQKEFDNLLGIKNGNLSYDFYLPKYNLLIEYQGEQHEKPIDFNGRGKKYAQQKFEVQQEHDKRKKEYAENNNLNLLEIWYWDFNNIEQILSKELNKNKKN